MEPFSLRCFVAVARSGSFSRAAEELYRTQPAVSLQVRKLERELGRRLFDRSRRSPVMTDAGRALYPGARDLLQRLDRLPELADVSGAEPAGTLTIASNLSLIGHFLPRAVYEFHGRYPRVRLRFLNRTSRGIVRALDEGEADIGIGFLVEERPEMDSAVLFRSPFVLVTARAVRGSPRGVSLDTVLAGPVIHFEEGVDVRRFLEQALTGRRSLEPVIELPSIELIIQFVSSGFGGTILPEFAIAKEWRKRLVVRRLGPSVQPLEVRSFVSRQRTVSRGAAAFLDLLRPMAKSAASTPQ